MNIEVNLNQIRNSISKLQAVEEKLKKIAKALEESEKQLKKVDSDSIKTFRKKLKTRISDIENAVKKYKKMEEVLERILEEYTRAEKNIVSSTSSMKKFGISNGTTSPGVSGGGFR